MKGRYVLAVVLTLVVFTAGWTAYGFIANAVDHESVRLEVLKVFSAKDGNALYRSYLVRYKDQEVIVPDTLIKTNHKVGDIVSVLVMRHKYPQDKKDHGLLSFSILPAP